MEPFNISIVKNRDVYILNYSGFYLERVKSECEKTIPESALPEFRDEIRSLEEYLAGKVSADYILRYWKPYEYARNPYES